MNALVVGSDRSPLVRYIPNDNFLLIDDGPVIDEVLSSHLTVRIFDVTRDSFDPLKDMDYRRAREFLDVLNAVFPEGENTLTRRYSNFVLLNALLSGSRTLSGLIKQPDPRSKDMAVLDAFQKVQTLLLSPVLERVLNRTPNVSLKGTVVARLDRAELGDFDCYVLGNLLISQFPGTVVLPDFGFYAAPFHTSLIRQDRLIAGINSFDEVPRFRQLLVQIGKKVGSRCTPEDAATLAIYEGIPPNTNAYADFIQQQIRPS